jgi:hypothetical protein
MKLKTLNIILAGALLIFGDGVTIDTGRYTLDSSDFHVYCLPVLRFAGPMPCGAGSSSSMFLSVFFQIPDPGAK